MLLTVTMWVIILTIVMQSLFWNTVAHTDSLLQTIINLYNTLQQGLCGSTVLYLGLLILCIGN